MDAFRFKLPPQVPGTFTLPSIPWLKNPICYIEKISWSRAEGLFLAFNRVETVLAASAGSVYTWTDCKVATLISLDHAKVKGLLAISAYPFIAGESLWLMIETERDSIATCSSEKLTISGAKISVLVKGTSNPCKGWACNQIFKIVRAQGNLCKGHIEVTSELK